MADQIKTSTLPIQVRVLDQRLAGRLPTYATPGSAAIDLPAAIGDDLTIQPGHRHLIHTGLAMWVQNPGYVALIFPRSGLGARGLVLGNTVGVIDADYQGEIMLCLFNAGPEPITISPLQRVAQMLITTVARIDWQVVERFSDHTERGAGGYGSTGV